MNYWLSQDDILSKLDSTLDGLVPISLVWYDYSELKFTFSDGVDGWGCEVVWVVREIEDRAGVGGRAETLIYPYFYGGGWLGGWCVWTDIKANLRLN